MDMKDGWLLWCTNFLIKSAGSGVANNEVKQNLQLAKNYTNQLLETLKKEQFIQNLKTIFGVLI